MSWIDQFIFNAGPAGSGQTLFAAVVDPDGTTRIQKDLPVTERGAGSGISTITADNFKVVP